MDVIDQLYEAYVNEHDWIKDKLPKYEIDAYHRILVKRGNIICEELNDKLVGYIEVLKVTPEQFGYLVLEHFAATPEDTLSGQVAVVSNVWIDKKHRNTKVMKDLKDKFMDFTKECYWFTGIALRNKTQPVKVFTRKNLEQFMSLRLGV